MTRFKIGDKVVWAPRSTSKQMETSGVISRVYDAKPGIPQEYDLTDSDGHVWWLVSDDELTLC